MEEKIDARKACKNPSCPRTILSVKKAKNRGGLNAYCSLLCLSAWSPSMDKVALGLGATNQAELLGLLNSSIKRLGLKASAKVVGVSSITLRSWVEKLQLVVGRVSP